MNWITNYVRPTINSLFSRREVPENLWTKCPECGTMLFHRELKDNLNVCTTCDHHMGITPRELLREKDTPYAELGLNDLSLTDDQLLDAMLAHPILINRPIVETPKGTRLCRPSEAVVDLLDHPVAEFAKEDGEAVRREGGRDA